MDVLNRVQRIYSIDPGQVFLTGHSMGGQGTWTLGFKHPDKFAALAPVAGRPQDAAIMKSSPAKPVLFSQGGKDTLATPEQARLLAEAAKKQLTNFKYQEYPDDDHFVVRVHSLPAIFDFFDAWRK